MIRAERVLETRMRPSGIDEIRQTELPDVPQPLKHRRVDEAKRQTIDTDVIPEWVPKDFQPG